jgi:hypothetical protein
MKKISAIDAILFDIDGVMVTSWQALLGVADVVVEFVCWEIFRMFLINIILIKCFSTIIIYEFIISKLKSVFIPAS